MTQIELRGVTERDVDLLLLEELVISSDFREWFGEQLGFGSLPVLDRAERSVNTSTGESDLELSYSIDARRIRVLIENKIDAPLQPRQAERYEDRAKGYIAKLECDQTIVLLVAPKKYVNSVDGFANTMSYESLQDWFSESMPDDLRSLYKYQLLQKAISRSDSGWSLVPDPVVTEFWKNYWSLASQIAAELQFPNPSQKPASSSFVYFRPTDLPAKVQLVHKITHGNVDLQFAGLAQRRPEAREQFQAALEESMLITTAGRSLVVRVQVPSVSLESPFPEAKHCLTDALKASLQVLNWYRKHRQGWNQFCGN